MQNKRLSNDKYIAIYALNEGQRIHSKIKKSLNIYGYYMNPSIYNSTFVLTMNSVVEFNVPSFQVVINHPGH